MVSFRLLIAFWFLHAFSATAYPQTHDSKNANAIEFFEKSIVDIMFWKNNLIIINFDILNNIS